MNEIINRDPEFFKDSSTMSQWEQLKEVPFSEGTRQIEESPKEPIEQQGRVTELQSFESIKGREAYRPVGEMEQSEIAREYMDLLHDLSNNFTSPEAVHSAVVKEDGTVRDRRGYSGDEHFVEDLYKKNGLELDRTNNYDELRENGRDALAELHYENADLDRAHTLKMVDSILSGEQKWRDAGECYAEAQSNLTDAIEKLNQLQAEHKSKSFFNRIVTMRNFRKQTKEIDATITRAKEDLSRAEWQSQNGNQTLTGSLEAAYSPDYHYGHHKLNYQHEMEKGYKEQINEEYNNKFFGADDPIRQDKINRALELRKALKVR